MSQLPHDIAALIISTQIVDGLKSGFNSLITIRLKYGSPYFDSKIRRKVKRYKAKGLSASERRVRVSEGIFSYWLFAFKQNRFEYRKDLITTLEKLRAAGVSEDDIDKVKQDNEKDYWHELSRQLVVYIVEIPLIKCVKRYFKIQP